MRRFEIDPERSTIVVEARSNVGPIAWEGTRPVGEFAFAPEGDAVAVTPPPRGWLEIRLESFTSGNRIYDSELLRRVNAHRFPVATVELEAVGAREPDDTYQVSGRATIHGVAQRITGRIGLELLEDGSALVTGMQVIDIRVFGLPPPTMLTLKVYPEVRVHLIIKGDPID